MIPTWILMDLRLISIRTPMYTYIIQNWLLNTIHLLKRELMWLRTKSKIIQQFRIDTNDISEFIKYVNFEPLYKYSDRIILIFEKEPISLIDDKRLTGNEFNLLNGLPNKHDEIIFAQTNTSTNMTAGTLISILKQHTLGNPKSPLMSTMIDIVLNH